VTPIIRRTSIAAGQRRIFTAGVTASAASRITVAHTPDQKVMPPSAIGNMP
jgi:hypothetical protein